MSVFTRKTKKLFTNPRKFLIDAVQNKLRYLKIRKKLARIAKDPRIPTYALCFNDWKRSYYEDIYPERNFVFVPMHISTPDFKKLYLRQILAEKRSEIFCWGLKAPEEIVELLREHKLKMHFIEDGFIRSISLGSMRTPGFSICVDTKAPYFDARHETDLETLLKTYDFDGGKELMARAARLMEELLESGLSKYNNATPVDIEKIYGPKTKRRVMVVGQVEDDASILYGSAKKYTNNDAVMIAAMENPDAHIIYKPHPDVLHKKRAELSNPDDVRHVAQVLDQDIPLHQSFETIDHVYTITSQAGFEALMRGIKVTTLGCPFYAGWGLTDARQPNERRNRNLTVLQVFAGAYILYPKYFNPFYKTTCKPEEVIDTLRQLRDIETKQKKSKKSATVVEALPTASSPQLDKTRKLVSDILRAALKEIEKKEPPKSNENDENSRYASG